MLIIIRKPVSSLKRDEQEQEKNVEEVEREEKEMRKALTNTI
jgi:hypothetical protein